MTKTAENGDNSQMNDTIENGSIRDFDDKPHIYYDGYWIRYYKPPRESLSTKKILLDALTKRAFRHTEAGINTPGSKLEQARQAWMDEERPDRKRVNAAMLAGALFNRATDIFTTIVELEQKGIKVTRENQLMQQCSECFHEALELCDQVRHHSGEESIDELWGEPVKVFTMPVQEYYTSRYIKIAQAMRDMDIIGQTMIRSIASRPFYHHADELITSLIEIAKRECELLRTDPLHFTVWPHFVSACEKLKDYQADIPSNAENNLEKQIKRGVRLIRKGQKLICWIANVRVPMPKSTTDYISRCQAFDEQCKAFKQLQVE